MVRVNKPKVVVYSSASVDGRLTIAPGVLLLYGDRRWDAVYRPGNAYEWLKYIHRPGATLEGSGSFMAENQVPDPLPPVTGNLQSLYQDFLPEIIVYRPGHQGWFATVDGRGRVRWAVKDGGDWPGGEWKGWHLLVWACRRTPPEYLAYLQRENIPYLVTGEDRVDLRGALEKMNALLGVTCILSTAGGLLNGALLRAGLVDEININFFPAVIGGVVTPSLFDAPELTPGEWPTRLRLISVQAQVDGSVWLRYEVIPQSAQSGY
jgi:2,5-diamino-6-(ribosylamino)-4(3H)-pyrimidinone 5'-phosphate reductase